MKKGFSALEIVVAIIILLVVAVVLLFVFRNYFGKETEVIGEQISSLGDCDCDGVRNFLDKCPCIAVTAGNENPKLDGCPAGQGAVTCSKTECETAMNGTSTGNIKTVCKP
jgi:prepilin-type N-terminal cleavage/methylation domain-containing protein